MLGDMSKLKNWIFKSSSEIIELFIDMTVFFSNFFLLLGTCTRKSILTFLILLELEKVSILLKKCFFSLTCYKNRYLPRILRCKLNQRGNTTVRFFFVEFQPNNLEPKKLQAMQNKSGGHLKLLLLQL